MYPKGFVDCHDFYSLQGVLNFLQRHAPNDLYRAMLSNLNYSWYSGSIRDDTNWNFSSVPWAVVDPRIINLEVPNKYNVSINKFYVTNKTCPFSIAFLGIFIHFARNKCWLESILFSYILSESKDARTE